MNAEELIHHTFPWELAPGVAADAGVPWSTTFADGLRRPDRSVPSPVEVPGRAAEGASGGAAHAG